jgi:3D (Asp-Asp-Asp) domain-containing protein
MQREYNPYLAGVLFLFFLASVFSLGSSLEKLWGLETPGKPLIEAESKHPIHEFDLQSSQPPPQPSKEVEIAQTFEAFAYTWTGNKTATGTWPEEGRTVAVDPTVIPLGSELVINGIPGYIAEDTGEAIKGRVVDIYMESETACYEWGRRPVKMIVLPREE